MRRTRTKQSGFTLIELLIVITIMGILAAVATSGEESGSQGARVTSQVGFMDQVAAAATEYRATVVNFTNIDMATLCTVTSLSSQICGPSNNGQASNVYGGNYVVAVASGNPGQYTLQITNVQNGEEALISQRYASKTADRCTNGSTGCATIATATGSVTATMN